MAHPRTLNYLSNVANHAARQFYLDHGATQVDWALEVQDKLKTKGERQKTDDNGLLLMTCRYCIRHELGMCKKKEELRMKNEELRTTKGTRANSGNEGATKNDGRELFLRLADGRRFRLHFDCKRCQMEVYSVINKN